MDESSRPKSKKSPWMAVGCLACPTRLLNGSIPWTGDRAGNVSQVESAQGEVGFSVCLPVVLKIPD